jgi:hypothetical protein
MRRATAKGGYRPGLPGGVSGACSPSRRGPRGRDAAPGASVAPLRRRPPARPRGGRFWRPLPRFARRAAVVALAWPIPGVRQGPHPSLYRTANRLTSSRPGASYDGASAAAPRWPWKRRRAGAQAVATANTRRHRRPDARDDARLSPSRVEARGRDAAEDTVPRRGPAPEGEAPGRRGSQASGRRGGEASGRRGSQAPGRRGGEASGRRGGEASGRRGSQAGAGRRTGGRRRGRGGHDAIG